MAKDFHENCYYLLLENDLEAIKNARSPILDDYLKRNKIII